MLLRPVLMPILRNPLQGIADGIRNMLAELLGSSQFFAPRTHSLVLARGTGSPTFTRADATNCATFTDWEGVLRTVPSGCARFEGARMVRNLLTFTEDFSNAAWTKINGGAGSAPTVTSGFTDPDGGATAWRLQANRGGNAGGDYSIVRQAHSSGNCRAIYIKSNTASTQEIYFGAANGPLDKVSATTSWTRVSNPNTVNALTDIGSYGATGNATQSIDILIWHPQVEDVTGQADQTASEYVSVGVPSDWAGPEHVSNGTFDSTTTGWTAVNSTIVVENAELKLQNVGVVFGYAYQAVATVVGAKYVASCLARQSTAATLFYSVGTTPAGVDNGQANTTSTTSTLLQVSFTATATTTYITTQNNNANNGISYVDNISVKPAIYHGAGVDGVEFFNTDRDGAVIPAATNTGYLAEGARTNVITYSQAFDNADWTKVNGGAGSVPVVTANSTIAPDGTTTAAKVVFAAPGSGDQSQLISKAFTPTGGAAYAGTVYLKAFAAGDIGKQLLIRHVGAGTYTTMTLSADWQRLGSTETAFAVPLNLEIGLRPVVGGGSAGTVSCYLWGAQVELGSSASTYIATTTAAVTRAADVDATPTADNILAAAGTVYLEFTPDHTPSGTIALWGTYVDASNYTAILHDATNMIMRKRIAGMNYDATIANAFSANTTYKVCGSWGASGVTVTVNGTEGTPHANTTAAQIAATMQWGADGNSLQQPFATERNARVWQRQLSASERGAITA